MLKGCRKNLLISIHKLHRSKRKVGTTYSGEEETTLILSQVSVHNVEHISPATDCTTFHQGPDSPLHFAYEEHVRGSDTEYDENAIDWLDFYSGAQDVRPVDSALHTVEVIESQRLTERLRNQLRRRFSSVKASNEELLYVLASRMTLSVEMNVEDFDVDKDQEELRRNTSAWKSSIMNKAVSLVLMWYQEGHIPTVNPEAELWETLIMKNERPLQNMLGTIPHLFLSYANNTIGICSEVDIMFIHRRTLYLSQTGYGALRIVTESTGS
ncbi:hypothetical protein Tco_0909395 [Tanacetum coccineum]|uniref:Uncharacterized protein n=1 Tax=Tanacetum coccineum TaxID=301880 RepID=A0ABQ5CQ07_9ASTR